MRIRWALLVALSALVISDLATAQFAAHAYDIRRYEVTIRPDFATGDLQIDTQIGLDKAAAAQAFRFGLSTQFSSVAGPAASSRSPLRHTLATCDCA